MTAPLAGKTVLVVEDDDDFRHTLSETLQALSATVSEAEGGWSAWEMIQRQPFDVVLTDLRMPSGSGLELIGRIHALGPGRPSIVAISGHADIVSDALGPSGADVFIAKPFGIDALLGAIESSRHRARNGG